MSLTAPERETVITFSDDGGRATVHTHQRRIITKLRDNPAATLIEDATFEGTPGAVFELAADRISFLGPRRKRQPSEAQKAAVAKMRAARAEAA